jgi:hypothetical protein
VKKTVKILLFFCPRFPSPRPNDASQLAAWHRDLADIAKQGMKQLIDSIPDPPIQITATYVANFSNANQWENPKHPNAKTFPNDTPQSVLVHFGVPAPK